MQHLPSGCTAVGAAFLLDWCRQPRSSRRQAAWVPGAALAEGPAVCSGGHLPFESAAGSGHVVGSRLVVLVLDDEDCVGHEPGDVNTQAFRVLRAPRGPSRLCRGRWARCGRRGPASGQSSWRRSWAARGYLRPVLCQGEQAGFWLAPACSPTSSVVHNSPLLARCNAAMEPVPDCVVSRDAAEPGMCAALHAVLVHPGAAGHSWRCGVCRREIGPGPSP